MKDIIKNQYDKILDDMVFSFSTLRQYENCAYAFYNRKIDGIEINEGNFYADIGKYVHEINAMIFNNKITIDKAIDYFIDNYDSNVLYTAKQSTVDKKYEQAIDYFACFDTEVLHKYEILAVEKEVHFKVDKYNFIGFIDLLLRDKETNEILLVDHKSLDHFLKKDGKPLKNQLKHFKTYSNQMYLYSKAIYDEYGAFPGRIIWNHFFEQTVTNIPFKTEDYDNALKWAVDTIQSIYKDVEFLPKKDYFMCNVLCGYRNSCCYAKDEEVEEN